MALTLSNVPLILSTSEIDAWIEKNIPLSEAWVFGRRSWPGFGLAGLTFRTDLEMLRPVRPGLFLWPQGASRWAYGYFLCSTYQYTQIRTLAYGDDGSLFNPLNLFMDSPGIRSIESVQTRVYLLRALPLFRVPAAGNDPQSFVNGLYLLTVVDNRFYWQWSASPNFNITSTTTWQNLLDQIGTNLNITINYDTIDSRYLQPSKQLNLAYENTALILDAVCWNIGHRFVKKLDSTYYTQSYTTAKAARDADIAAHPDRTIRAGGEMYVRAL